MNVRGALHAHTDLSHDGTLTVRELAGWYQAYGYNFIAITEHSQDMNAEKVAKLHAEAKNCSSDTFCVIPGIEYTCSGKIHLPGIGVTALLATDDPVLVANEIGKLGGFSILAHPRRMGWQCPDDLLRAVDAVEIWNVGYDGKYVPSPAALDAFPKMKKINPSLLAIAAHDLHRTVSFYDVALAMDLPRLNSNEIIQNLKNGTYRIESKMFKSESSGAQSWANSVRLKTLSHGFGLLRTLRKQVLRMQHATDTSSQKGNQN